MGTLGEDLRKGLKEAIDHADGKRDLRTTVLPAVPPKRSRTEIKTLRLKLGYSQAVFARGLNVSVKTFQAWEQGLRQPSGSALKLLAIAERHPEVVFG